jgi:ABC-type glycerol-3-phosphate transport system permease component
MRLAQRLLVYILLVLGAVTCLIPLAWMISTGLKPIEQTMSSPPTWLPYRLYVEKDGALTEIQQADMDKYPADKIVKKFAPRWENF